MKVTVKKRTRQPAYPNAATHQFNLCKIVDAALTVLTAVGGVTALTFLIML